MEASSTKYEPVEPQMESSQGTGVPEDERQCRICFDTGSDGEQGPLFRPCHCRGSMAWVHRECLDHWRRSSVNPRSFYRCDNCCCEYRFGRAFVAYDRFTLARLLDTRGAVHLLSMLVLGCLVFTGGFVAKSFSPGLTWWEVVSCFNLEHLIYGSTLTGVGSLLGWLISLVGGGGGWWVRTLDLGGAGRLGGPGGNDKAGKIILAILVVVGVCVAFKWIYDRIEKYAEKAVRTAQCVVLEGPVGTVTEARRFAT